MLRSLNTCRAVALAPGVSSPASPSFSRTTMQGRQYSLAMTPARACMNASGPLLKTSAFLAAGSGPHNRREGTEGSCPSGCGVGALLWSAWLSPVRRVVAEQAPTEPHVAEAPSWPRSSWLSRRRAGTRAVEPGCPLTGSRSVQRRLYRVREVLSVEVSSADPEHGLVDAHEQFARNLRQQRLRVGLSQEALGELCGLHRTEISLLERAGREPRLSTIVRIARALRVVPASLLDGIN